MSLQHLLASTGSDFGVKNCLGYFASALVLTTFSVTSMRKLRCIAILSNLVFIAYALAAGLLPVLILHCLLLPTNLFRLLQLEFTGRSRNLDDRLPDGLRGGEHQPKWSSDSAGAARRRPDNQHPVVWSPIAIDTELR